MTLSDIKNLSVVEFENLLDGMSEYADEVEKELNGGKKKYKNKLEGQEGINYLLNTFKK